MWLGFAHGSRDEMAPRWSEYGSAAAIQSNDLAP
jgi:hypothetical protein